MALSEGHIHVAMRNFLKREGWLLIAGQYPGGSDDELHALNVVDPNLARDNSPDPRRHSKGKLVPDLLAFRNNQLLIVEAKPKYSRDDRDKLRDLLDNRLNDFLGSLEKFATERRISAILPLNNLLLIPALAFSAQEFIEQPDPGFIYIRITNLTEARLEGPF
ncbi:hypothetical protein [Anaeroselena agilis]|uniref:Uncharacterized protein n=1 Tax=Anaeroselena agilis TaxID=3063788 RepID=A0ABU3P2J2_9FIRM|nr:hypothetical protein [Selenomonadales bacterium 4137-cl]